MKHFRITLIIVSLSRARSRCSVGLRPAGNTRPVHPDGSGMVGAPLNLTGCRSACHEEGNCNRRSAQSRFPDLHGVHLSDLLAKAQVQSGAANLVFSASDNYSAQIDVATVNGCTDCNGGLYQYGWQLPAGNAKPGLANCGVKNLIKIEVK